MTSFRLTFHLSPSHQNGNVKWKTLLYQFCHDWLTSLDGGCNSRTDPNIFNATLSHILIHPLLLLSLSAKCYYIHGQNRGLRNPSILFYSIQPWYTQSAEVQTRSATRDMSCCTMSQLIILHGANSRVFRLDNNSSIAQRGEVMNLVTAIGTISLPNVHMKGCHIKC